MTSPLLRIPRGFYILVSPLMCVVVVVVSLFLDFLLTSKMYFKDKLKHFALITLKNTFVHIVIILTHLLNFLNIYFFVLVFNQNIPFCLSIVLFLNLAKFKTAIRFIIILLINAFTYSCFFLLM